MIRTDLIFIEVEISGLMSFPPGVRQKLYLNTNRLTAIIGENLDIGDGERNGCGKTAILDAILYLYFGKTFRVASNQSLINNVEPGPLFVTGSARRDGIVFHVERGENPSVLRLFEKPADDDRDWYTKEAGKFLFERTKSTKPETTKRIAELLGFDLKLSDVLLFNNASDRSCFFLKNEEDQRNIVERVFGFTVFTEKADRLRELRKEENKNLTTKESALIATRQANDRVLRQIEAIETKSDEWAAERDKLARFLTQQIHSYEGIDFPYEIGVLTEVDHLSRKLAEMQRDFRNLEQNLLQTEQRRQQWEETHSLDIQKLASTITTLQQADAEADIQTIKDREFFQNAARQAISDLAAAKKDLASIQERFRLEQNNHDRVKQQIEDDDTQLVQLDDAKCPTCGQDWIDTHAHRLDCITAREVHRAELDQIKARLADLASTRAIATGQTIKHTDDRDEIHKRLGALPQVQFQTIEEAAAAHTRLAELTKTLEQEQQDQNPHTEGVEQLIAAIQVLEDTIRVQKAIIETKPQTYYTSLTEAQTTLTKFDQIKLQFTELQQTVNPHRETIDNLRTDALKHVDDSEIQALRTRIEHMSLLITLLADRDSPIRKTMLEEWLPELNSKINRYLELLELPHRVEFDPNMTATFLRENKPLTFGNLSTGEKLRVWLATNLGFREIFELINYKINLLFVDEVLDKGLSARGAQVSYRLFEQMVDQGRSVFLISHRQELVDMATNVMTVTLENGLSTIRY